MEYCSGQVVGSDFAMAMAFKAQGQSKQRGHIRVATVVLAQLQVPVRHMCGGQLAIRG